MAGFITRRLAQGVVVMFLVTLLTFFLVNLAPGGPASVMRIGSTAEERAALVHQLGLDRPIVVQYLSWAGNILLHGDFGSSLTGGQPVGPLLMQRLWNTAKLAITVFILLIIVGTALGTLAALHRDNWPDVIINILSTGGMSIPDFWLGIMAILFFAVQLQILPASGMGDTSGGANLWQTLAHMILPVAVLTIATMPNIIRYARSSMLESLTADYMRTARSKGLSEWIIIGKHALKNSLISVVSMLGILLPVLLSGAVITESVFGWPGMGRLAVDAAMHRDYPTIMGATVVAGAVVILTNLLVDVVYMLIDPRIRHE